MAGIITNDRKQGARVRRLLLTEIERLFSADPLSLSETEQNTKRELLLRMAPNTLPRLTEVTGEGGGPVVFTLSADEKQKLDSLLNAEQTSTPESNTGDAGGEDLSLQ